MFTETDLLQLLWKNLIVFVAEVKMKFDIYALYLDIHMDH